MVRTVIFDMDGVFVDTEPLHHEASLHQFKYLGIEVPNEMYHTFTGNSNKMTPPFRHPSKGGEIGTACL